MKGFLASVCVLFAVIWVSMVAHSNLPERVEYGNVSLNPNASVSGKVALRTVIAFADQEVSDYFLFRTAKMRFGDREIHFVALPGTKWMAL